MFPGCPARTVASRGGGNHSPLHPGGKHGVDVVGLAFIDNSAGNLAAEAVVHCAGFEVAVDAEGDSSGDSVRSCIREECRGLWARSFAVADIAGKGFQVVWPAAVRVRGNVLGFFGGEGRGCCVRCQAGRRVSHGRLQSGGRGCLVTDIPSGWLGLELRLPGLAIRLTARGRGTLSD